MLRGPGLLWPGLRGPGLRGPVFMGLRGPGLLLMAGPVDEEESAAGVEVKAGLFTNCGSKGRHYND